MRKSQKIITTALWSFLVLTMVSVVGLGMWTRQDQPAARVGAAQSDAPMEQGLPIWYDAPSFAMTDQNGRPFSSDQLKGQVWVAAFIFTNCPGVCPMMTQQMATLQKTVPSPNVKLVSFSVDPARDTPAVLREYASRFKADGSRWHFLTGAQDEMLRTAAGLRRSVMPAEGDRPLDHDQRFLLVDAQGRGRGAYQSKDADELARLAGDAETLADGKG